MIGTGQLRRARDEALKLARMTREDVRELTAVFLQVASRQAKDARTSLAKRLR